MADLGTLALLIADIQARVTTNGNNENTGARVEACLENIVDTLAGLQMSQTEDFTPTTTYPVTWGGVAIKDGATFRITGAGDMGAISVLPGDLLIALVDTPAQTDGNWLLIPGRGSLGVLLGNLATTAAARAALGAAPQHYIDGVPQSGSTYTFTGATGGADLTVNLATATPAMASAYLIDARSQINGTQISGRLTDVTMATFTVRFWDIEAAALVGDATSVQFTVGGTLA